ncbi:MAG: alpha-amylase family glycosyl hydrolase [Stellaceae bacterium]
MPDSVFGKEVEDAFAIARRPARRTIRIDDGDVEIVSPFPSPGDWRDQWIYFLLVDRFNNPDRPPAAAWDQPFGGFQGGTLEGVRRRLGYLQRLGVGAIWLSPVLQNCQAQDGTYHGYGIQHFLTVDPRFASNRSDPDGELRRLVDEAHARGIYVIMDIVLHHAGDVFAYVLDNGAEVSAAQWRDGGYPVRWRDADNRAVADWSQAPQKGDPRLVPTAAVWPDEIRSNLDFLRKGMGGEAGGDFDSLKGFARPAPPQLRSALIRSYQHAIAKWDIDGFRIDTLKYIEPEFALVFGNAVREFALEIGKKNFFTFGEVYDDELKIASFIGRRATDQGDLIGVDAALDFPLFFRLPGVAKGLAPPSEVTAVYALRKSVEDGVISSHGEAGRYFVTFLDNHDQHNRFRFVDPAHPGRYDGQVAAGFVSLFSLQGIPCVYYGTEQGLSGNGSADQNVREALWGRPNAFDEADPFYVVLRGIASARAQDPALRYGRQYFRPVSGDRRSFGPSSFAPGVLAFSRILNESETVVIANTNSNSGIELSVLVDAVLNPGGAIFSTVFSSTGNKQTCTVEEIADAQVNDGGTSRGTVHSIRAALDPGEARIVARRP